MEKARIGDTVKVYKSKKIDVSPQAQQKVLHDVLCGLPPVDEYTVKMLLTQEMVDAYNQNRE